MEERFKEGGFAGIKKMAEFKNPFNNLQTALFIALIVFFGFLYTSTQSVPNWDNDTQSTLYSLNEDVPKSGVSLNQAGLGIILIIFLAMSFAKKGTKISDRATPDEAQKILDKYLEKRKNVRLGDGTVITIGNYHIDTAFLPRYKEDKTGTKMFRYVLQVRVTDSNKLPHFFKGYVHPYERYVDGFVEMKGPLEGKDECEDCGKEYSFKLIDTEDYQTFKKIKEDIR